MVPLITPPKVTIDNDSAKTTALRVSDSFLIWGSLDYYSLLLGNNDTYHV